MPQLATIEQIRDRIWEEMVHCQYVALRESHTDLARSRPRSETDERDDLVEKAQNTGALIAFAELWQGITGEADTTAMERARVEAGALYVEKMKAGLAPVPLSMQGWVPNPDPRG